MPALSGVGNAVGAGAGGAAASGAAEGTGTGAPDGDGLAEGGGVALGGAAGGDTPRVAARPLAPAGAGDFFGAVDGFGAPGVGLAAGFAVPAGVAAAFALPVGVFPGLPTAFLGCSFAGAR